MAHATDVTAVSGELDALTEIHPVVFGAASSNPLGIVSGLSKYRECLSEGFLLLLMSDILLVSIAGSRSAMLASNQS